MLARGSKRLLACLLIGLILMAGASRVPAQSLPPAKPVSALTDVEGTWEGTAAGRPLTMTFKGDGSYDAVLVTGPAKGSLTISDGKVLFKSATTGRTGTLRLHEGDGKRLLIGSTSDGIQFELKPAR